MVRYPERCHERHRVARYEFNSDVRADRTCARDCASGLRGQSRLFAKALDVLVVGTEVSNDHVVQTREKLETVEQLLERLLPSGANGEGAKLRTLAKEATGDVIVIDTLATELNDRMRGAVDRVAELNDVVERLNRLVNGSRGSEG